MKGRKREERWGSRKCKVWETRSFDPLPAALPTLGSFLSNDDGDDNEKGKKQNSLRLAKKALRFLVNFFVVSQKNCLISRFV